MKEVVINWLNWITTAGVASLIAYVWRLSYRLTKTEKDIEYLKVGQKLSSEADKDQMEILQEIRDRITRLEVVLKVKEGDYSK